MVVGIKDAAKLIGISIIACCAVLVCTLFLNFNMDIGGIEKEITSEQMMILYNAQISTSKVVCWVSGGCLLITSVIMLMFYIKHYIDIHKKELGILKALGFSNFRIAKHFWIFGISVFIGTLAGFCGAFLMMPFFYNVQNKDKILPGISVHFHPALFMFLVILPTAGFAVLSIFYSYFKLKKPVLKLLKNNIQSPLKIKKYTNRKNADNLFIDDLRMHTLKSKKTLVFFIIFASFCYSAMTQMSYSMRDFSSEMMGVMMLMIGIILACTTLFLAITTVINGNIKTIAMMRVFGYSHKECCKALLGGYRPMAYIGFGIGTVYQYALLRIMVDVVFKNVNDTPVYEFDFPVMLVSLVSFIFVYEIVMHLYADKIKKMSIKIIMTE